MEVEDKIMSSSKKVEFEYETTGGFVAVQM